MPLYLASINVGITLLRVKLICLYKFYAEFITHEYESLTHHKVDTRNYYILTILLITQLTMNEYDPFNLLYSI